MWCSQCHYFQAFQIPTSGGETHLSDSQLESEIDTVIPLFPTISIRQCCPPYTQTLLISSLLWPGSLFVLVKECMRDPAVTRSFWTITIGSNEPRALLTLPSSDMFTLSFSSILFPKIPTTGLIWCLVWHLFLLTSFGEDEFLSKPSVRKTESPTPSSFTFPLSGEDSTVLSLWPRSRKEKTNYSQKLYWKEKKNLKTLL